MQTGRAKKIVKVQIFLGFYSHTHLQLLEKYFNIFCIKILNTLFSTKK